MNQRCTRRKYGQGHCKHQRIEHLLFDGAATPERGEHTDDILTSLGYDAATIAKLRDAKVVA